MDMKINMRLHHGRYAPDVGVEMSLEDGLGKFGEEL